jgi:Flp pilus assembly protein protease CpaA
MAGGLYFNRTGREAIGIGDAKLIGAGTLAVGASSLAAMLLVASVGGIVAGLSVVRVFRTSWAVL